MDGVQVYDGKLFVVDDPEDRRVSYDLRCHRHWLAGDAGPVDGQAIVQQGSEVEAAQHVV